MRILPSELSATATVGAGVGLGVAVAAATVGADEAPAEPFAPPQAAVSMIAVNASDAMRTGASSGCLCSRYGGVPAADDLEAVCHAMPRPTSPQLCDANRLVRREDVLRMR